MFDKILVPLDGSALAEAILPYVSELAGGLKAGVVLLSVIDSDSPAFRRSTADKGGSHAQREKLLEAAETQAHEYLTGLKSGLAVDAQALVRVGKPAERIIEEQQTRECDLIAMSTHGRTGLARGIVGSVTDKVLRLSDVPLLMFRPKEGVQPVGPNKMIGSLVVPLDGSELAESVLPYVEELARRLSLPITLVEAISVRIEEAFYGGGFYVDPTPIEQELLKDARAYLTELTSRLQGRGLNVSWKTVLDLPAQAIVQLSQESPGSLIAMSTRGQSGFTRLVLGSVTERVVREAGAPVLVVPPLRPAASP